MTHPMNARVLVIGIDAERMGAIASEFVRCGCLATLVAEPGHAARLLDEHEFDLLTIADNLLEEHRAPFEPLIRAASCAVLVIGDGHDVGIAEIALATIPTDALPRDAVIAGSVLVQQQLRSNGHTVRFGNLSLDPRTRTAILDHQPLVLTRLEFRILLVLAEAHGAVVSRSALERAVWGHDPVDNGSRISAHIRRLRRKLKAQGHSPDLLLTVRGEGFRLATEGAQVDTAGERAAPDLVFT